MTTGARERSVNGAEPRGSVGSRRRRGFWVVAFAFLWVMALGTVMSISPPERIAESLTGVFLAAYVGISVPLVGAGITLARHVTPKVTILGFAIAVTGGIAVSAIKLLRRLRRPRSPEDASVGSLTAPERVGCRGSALSWRQPTGGRYAAAGAASLGDSLHVHAVPAAGLTVYGRTMEGWTSSRIQARP